MFEIQRISYSPAISALGDCVIGWKRGSLRVFTMPIPWILTALPYIGLELGSIAVGLRTVRLNGIFGVAGFLEKNQDGASRCLLR